MSDVADVGGDVVEEHGLRHGVLGLFDSIIMGIAGSAPAYSIAGTTTVLFVTVLYGGAAALLYCGIFMFGIVFAFSYLSRDDSHAGAAYSWVRRALHPILGYLSGWALIVSALIFMVIATFPAGGSVISIFSSAPPSKTVPTIIGAVFFLLMVGAVAAGVTVTVTVQIIMSTIEVALLVLFAALALFHAHHVTSFSWHWFAPSVFHHAGSGTFAAGALIGYKAARAGKAFVKCNRWYPSSKACSSCGFVCESMPLDVRSWTCSKCETRHDRDVNAARNIRAEGLRILAGGEPAAAGGGNVSRGAVRKSRRLAVA